jgi:hypothetical protein
MKGAPAFFLVRPIPSPRVAHATKAFVFLSQLLVFRDQSLHGRKVLGENRLDLPGLLVELVDHVDVEIPQLIFHFVLQVFHLLPNDLADLFGLLFVVAIVLLLLVVVCREDKGWTDEISCK